MSSKQSNGCFQVIDRDGNWKNITKPIYNIDTTEDLKKISVDGFFRENINNTLITIHNDFDNFIKDYCKVHYPSLDTNNLDQVKMIFEKERLTVEMSDIEFVSESNAIYISKTYRIVKEKEE